MFIQFPPTLATNLKQKSIKKKMHTYLDTHLSTKYMRKCFNDLLSNPEH